MEDKYKTLVDECVKDAREIAHKYHKASHIGGAIITASITKLLFNARKE